MQATAARRLGWREPGCYDLTLQLVTHYSRVRQEPARRRDALAEYVSDAYIERMIHGLGHRIAAGGQGHPAWGILHFSKPAA